MYVPTCQLTPTIRYCYQPARRRVVIKREGEIDIEFDAPPRRMVKEMWNEIDDRLKPFWQELLDRYL